MRQCVECGRQFDSADRFCQFCGVGLTKIADAPAAVVPPVSAPPLIAKATPTPRTAPDVVFAHDVTPTIRHAPSALPHTPPVVPTPVTPTVAGWNGLAIASVVLLLFGITIVSIPLGHMALKQIATTGQRGRRLAIGALVLSYLVLLFWVILTVVGAASAARQ